MPGDIPIEFYGEDLNRIPVEPRGNGSQGSKPMAKENPEPKKFCHGFDDDLVPLVDIEAMQFEFKPIIRGLLANNESLLLVAESGTGKSLLLNYLLFSLAVPPVAGIFGKYEIARPFSTLLIQSENPTSSQSFRLKRLFTAHPEFKKAGSRVVCLAGERDIRLSGNIRSADFRKRVKGCIERSGADILVLDPLISFHNADENSNTEMRATLDCLTDLSDAAGVATIVTHHTGKNGDSRGASAIKDWVANQLKFVREQTEQPGRHVLRVINEKARSFPKSAEFFIEMTKNFDFVPCDDPRGKEAVLGNAVVDALKKLGGKVGSQAELVSELISVLSCGATWAKAAIRMAESEKKIVSFQGKGGRATGYRLP